MQVNTLVGTATGKAVEEGEARGRVSRERQQLLQGELLDKVFYLVDLRKPTTSSVFVPLSILASL